MLYKRRMERQLAAARGEGPAPERAPDDVSALLLYWFCDCSVGCACGDNSVSPWFTCNLTPWTGQLGATQHDTHVCLKLLSWLACLALMLCQLKCNIITALVTAKCVHIASCSLTQCQHNAMQAKWQGWSHHKCCTCCQNSRIISIRFC